jgi:hypothetical protein
MLSIQIKTENKTQLYYIVSLIFGEKMKKVMSFIAIAIFGLCIVGCSIKTEHNYYNQDGKKIKSETSKEKFQRGHQ